MKNSVYLLAKTNKCPAHYIFGFLVDLTKASYHVYLFIFIKNLHLVLSAFEETWKLKKQSARCAFFMTADFGQIDQKIKRPKM